MTHLIRPPSECMFPAADALVSVPRCIETLEVAVRDLLVNFWQEPLRERAWSLAQEMSDGCRDCGFRESSVLLRSLQALLALSVEDTRGIQRSIAERLLELIGILKERARRTQS